MKLLITCLLFFVQIFCVYSQEKTEGLLQSKLGLNVAVNSKWTHGFSLAHRSFILKEAFVYDTRHLDFAYFLSKKLKSGYKFSFGSMYRSLAPFNSNIRDEIRLTQQFEYRNRREKVIWKHRIRIEERLRRERTAIRLRYRLGINFPFCRKGLVTDDFYSIVNLEPVLSKQIRKRLNYEGRFTLGIGKPVSKSAKVQCMLHYRKLDITKSNRNQFFLFFELKYQLNK